MAELPVSGFTMNPLSLDLSASGSCPRAPDEVTVLSEKLAYPRALAPKSRPRTRSGECFPPPPTTSKTRSAVRSHPPRSHALVVSLVDSTRVLSSRSGNLKREAFGTSSATRTLLSASRSSSNYSAMMRLQPSRHSFRTATAISPSLPSSTPSAGLLARHSIRRPLRSRVRPVTMMNPTGEGSALNFRELGR
jgi:hypothetical protein